MSIKLMSLVWDMELSTFEKLVMLALADCANDDGECWPSIATLVRKTGAGERTVQRSIRALESAGLLRRVEVVGKGNRYFVTPATAAPRQTGAPPEKAKTPATAAPKPSRTIKSINTEGRGRLIPDDWRPMDFGSGSKSAAIVASWDREYLDTSVEHFVAHHQAKRTMASDWQPWWKTWVLNSKKFGVRNDRSNITPLRPPGGNGTGGRSNLARAIDEGLEWLG